MMQRCNRKAAETPIPSRVTRSVGNIIPCILQVFAVKCCFSKSYEMILWINFKVTINSQKKGITYLHYDEQMLRTCHTSDVGPVQTFCAGITAGFFPFEVPPARNYTGKRGIHTWLRTARYRGQISALKDTREHLRTINAQLYACPSSWHVTFEK